MAFNAYQCVPSFLFIVGAVPVVFVLGLLSSFSLGRRLLTKFPRFFSFGSFSDSGPSREQVADSSFTHTLIGYGHEGEEEGEGDAPKKKIVTRVSGPNAGYITTPICMVQAAYVMLTEAEKMPSK